METKRTRGLRGSVLEESINRTNQKYREQGLALVQKIPTPITPMKMEGSKITLAFFAEKSTVDYIGTVQGIPVCFDAKECRTKTFPMKNIHEHQVKFMRDFEKQGGIAFLIIDFTVEGICIYLPFKDLDRFWKRASAGGRKSFRLDEMDMAYRIEEGKGALVPYLGAIKTDLERRTKKCEDAQNAEDT